MFMTSCGQVNLQIPWELAGQSQASLTATLGGASSNGQPAAGGPKRYHVLNLCNPKSRPISINHCEPFLIPRDAALASGANTTAFVRNNSHAPAALPLHRLARKVLGATVGIALGGGAAFGIAHLGVLKVLEKNGIFIDLLAGCSQGSIIGVGYAAGVGNEEMIDIALGLGKIEPALEPPGEGVGDGDAEGEEEEREDEIGRRPAVPIGVEER